MKTFGDLVWAFKIMDGNLLVEILTFFGKVSKLSSLPKKHRFARVRDPLELE